MKEKLLKYAELLQYISDWEKIQDIRIEVDSGVSYESFSIVINGCIYINENRMYVEEGEVEVEDVEYEDIDDMLGELTDVLDVYL